MPEGKQYYELPTRGITRQQIYLRYYIINRLYGTNFLVSERLRATTDIPNSSSILNSNLIAELLEVSVKMP